VRADAVEAYQLQYPRLAERFRFIPTWMDPEVFSPAAPSEKRELRASVGGALGIRENDRVLVSVGRLDSGKRPLLMVDAFARLARARPELKLVLVGDGAVRRDIEARAAEHGLSGRVLLAGLRTPLQVADLLRLSDCFVLTSAYEGMPMCVLEALGCGIPVVSTRVGEVARVVKTGITGELVDAATPEGVAQAISQVLSTSDRYTAAACLAAVADYVPNKVLAPVFEQYRRLVRAPAVRPLIAQGLP
jgi:glycosyltransferase involved in cell wall biosynthesis